MRPWHFGWVAALILFLAPPADAVPPQRLLTLDDLARVRDLDEPQLSPDGKDVLYTVTTTDVKADATHSHLWLTTFDGKRSIPLTADSGSSENTPRFSPDGNTIAFLSSRGDAHENNQLWLYDRKSGKSRKLTDFAGGVVDYSWAPDGRRFALIVADPDKYAAGDGDTARPIVIDRYAFVQDVNGYQRDLRDHLYLYDIARRHADILTPGPYYEALPAFSPDGKSIAFVSRRDRDFDRDDNWDLFVIAARPGARPRALTTYAGNDNGADEQFDGSPPAWSPDGKFIAYRRGGDPKLLDYATNTLAVVPVAGGSPRILTPTLDRNIDKPQWAGDGKSILFLVEDDGTSWLARVPVSGGALQRVAGTRDEIWRFDGNHGRLITLVGNPHMPAEIFAREGATPVRRITFQNAWLDQVRLAPVKEIAFRSKDGTQVHGFLMIPPAGGTHLPTILRIHGGPQLQFAANFDFEQQLLAANGYAVIAANPRGSSGRGTKFSAAIFAGWGGVDVQDERAAVDYAVHAGVADPKRLGVGGWSYGAMLTNYLIASDTRFKAATSGAGESDILGVYGNDEYTHIYDHELGPPWKNLQVWLKVSYPFLHADRIHTPTLFLVGEKDRNVPTSQSEQMYQALRTLNVDTQLVVYPGQFHSFTTPSYNRDVLARYLDWYARYLKH